jgi:uncharacterized membrane protein YqaE (UPF0057 family)
MKENLFKYSVLTFTFLLVFSFSINAIDVKRNTSETSNCQYPEKVNLNKHDNSKGSVEKISLRERLRMVRELKKEMRKANKAKADVPMVVLYILAILLPPLAVGLFTNWGEPTLWNLLFTLFFWLPGIVHAFYILLR